MIDLTDNDDLTNIQKSIEKLKQEFGLVEEDDDDNMFDNEFIKNMFGVDLEEMERDMINNPPKPTLEYVKLHEDAVDPKYNYGTDSGFDLHSVADLEIAPMDRALVPTGLAFNIFKNCELQVRSKSGLALKQGLMVLNSPGTVDNGYNGEVKVILFNASSETIKINKGMKVAQAVVCPVIYGELLNLEHVSEIKERDRNANGFGSTGL